MSRLSAGSRSLRPRASPWCCLLLASLAVCEDSCPAGGGGPPSCRAAASASEGALTAAGAGGAALDSQQQRQADLITQEVEELEASMKLSADRIRLLKELQVLVASGKGNFTLPDSHVRALREKVPMLSEVAATPDGAASAAAEDYLVSKAIIPQEGAVGFVKFLPLRNPRSSSGGGGASTQTAMPSALLVAAQADGTVRLFAPSGELVLSFTAGHEHPVTHLTVSPSHDEYMLATGDAGGVIRVHKVSVRQRRLTKDQRSARRNSTDEKVSQYLGPSVNVTAVLHRQMQVPPGSHGEAPRVTALAVASQQGAKYFVAGDDEGKITVFTKNGTFHAKFDATATPGAIVEGLDSQLSNLLFRAGAEWGFVELDKLEVRHVECPKFEGRVAAAAIDSQQASRVLVADEQGSVWVFSIKNKKKECKLEHRFARGSTRAPIELASVRGFVLGLESAAAPGESASVLALNMSAAGRRPDRAGQPPPSPVVWRRSLSPLRGWAVHKRYQQGDLVAFLSQDGHEIEIMELLMQVYSAPAQDTLGNFKLPVIAVAIVLVLGYQYIKQKSPGGKYGGAAAGGRKFDFADSDFAAALKNKRSLGAAKLPRRG